MLIPQYTLRWLLGLMTVAAVFSAIFAMAVRGQLWAAGVSAAVAALVVVMLVYAALFVLVWGVSLGRRSRRDNRPGQSPFRETTDERFGIRD